MPPSRGRGNRKTAGSPCLVLSNGERAMSELCWQSYDHPDLMLEDLMGKITNAQLVTFVRKCWARITPFLPPVPHEYTVVDQFADLVPNMNAHDAVIYA